jgi:hypothetical protein
MPSLRRGSQRNRAALGQRRVIDELVGQQLDLRRAPPDRACAPTRVGWHRAVVGTGDGADDGARSCRRRRPGSRSQSDTPRRTRSRTENAGPSAWYPPRRRSIVRGTGHSENSGILAVSRVRLPAQPVHGVSDESKLDQTSHQNARGVRKRMVVGDVRLLDGLRLQQLSVRKRGQCDGSHAHHRPVARVAFVGGPCTVPCAMKRAMPRRQVLPMSGGREWYQPRNDWRCPRSRSRP